MLKLRLSRVGAKKQPSYRMVVAEATAPRDGRFVEVVGFYNPRTEPETVQLKEDRVLYWLSVGVQPTDAVSRILRTSGTQERFARMKAGEKLEVLVTEASAAAQPINLTTNPAVREVKEAVGEPEVVAAVEEEVPAEDVEA